jgi:hypothetical protein
LVVKFLTTFWTKVILDRMWTNYSRCLCELWCNIKVLKIKTMMENGRQFCRNCTNRAISQLLQYCGDEKYMSYQQDIKIYFGPKIAD